MTERDDIIETVTRLFWHTDHHEWPEVRAVFADRVHLDYTSLQGGEPLTLTPAEITDGWSQHFDTLDTHQHLVTNHLVAVDEGSASVTAQFIATHQTGDSTWTLGGDYHFALELDTDGWRITSMTMTAVWQSPGGLPVPAA